MGDVGPRHRGLWGSGKEMWVQGVKFGGENARLGDERVRQLGSMVCVTHKLGCKVLALECNRFWDTMR